MTDLSLLEIIFAVGVFLVSIGAWIWTSVQFKKLDDELKHGPKDQRMKND